MTRLPTVAGDSGAWGTVLNDYLTQNITSHYTLASSSTAAATALTIDKSAAGMLVGGTFVAVGAMTSKCEIRRVTAVSSATLTLNLALTYAHEASEFVWVVPGTWVPPEWFGCKANDPTFDSGTGIMQASIDAALTGNLFGLTGHGQRYYSSIPLSFYDNSLLDNITITAKSSFAVDCTIGERDGVPDQFFASTAGQFVTVTSVDTGANTITLSASIGTALGERLQFYAAQGATIPAPLETGRTYYLKTNPSGNAYTLSIDRDGSTLDLTSAGSGTTYCFSLGNTRIKWTGVTLEGASTQALNGLIAQLQQPARTVGLRVQEFPGGMGIMCLGGQQSDHFSTMLVDGHVGLRLQNGQFHYFHATNIEDCDVLLVSDDVSAYGLAAASKDVHFWGGHWEQAGGHSARIQTIIGSAPVSAGTFTLSFDGDTTSAIAFDATAATIQTALETLPDIDPGDVTVEQDGLLSDGGFMYCTFGGQYNYKVMTAPERITINAGGLTGGTYSVSYVDPDAAGISIVGQQAMLGIHGGIWSSNYTRPDGTIADFLRHEESGSITNGYLVEYLVSTGQGGNAINDLIRDITLTWADSTGVGERLLYFGVAGRHGGSSNTSWVLGGRLGGKIQWDEYLEQLQIEPTASLVIGNGTPLKAITTGATSVADGGTVTHSLGATPNVVNVTPSVSGEFVAVTALGATTFTVAIKKHDGTAGTTQTVYWEAVDI